MSANLCRCVVQHAVEQVFLCRSIEETGTNNGGVARGVAQCLDRQAHPRRAIPPSTAAGRRLDPAPAHDPVAASTPSISSWVNANSSIRTAPSRPAARCVRIGDDGSWRETSTKCTDSDGCRNSAATISTHSGDVNRWKSSSTTTTCLDSSSNSFDSSTITVSNAGNPVALVICDITGNASGYAWRTAATRCTTNDCGSSTARSNHNHTDGRSKDSHHCDTATDFPNPAGAHPCMPATSTPHPGPRSTRTQQ